MSDDTVLKTHWILLRGLAREARHWGDFPARFASELECSDGPSRVDAIDLPGAGRYSEMKCPLSISGIAEFTREKFLEIRERQREAGEPTARRSYLVAFSLGGMAAADWIGRWPRDFDGCVLVNTSFRGISPAHKRLKPSNLRHFFDILKTSDTYEREKRVLRMVSNRPELYEKTAEEWARIHDSRPISRENLARQFFAAARFQYPKFGPPGMPVLVMTSAGDRMVDASCSNDIAKAWNADLRVHPNGGHDLAVDDPDWVMAQIISWRKDR